MVLSHAFHQLSNMLLLYRDYWHFIPFEMIAQKQCPWHQAELDKLLDSLSADKLAEVDLSPELQQGLFGHIFPELFSCMGSVSLPVLTAQAKASKSDYPGEFKKGIADRKWQQIEKLSNALPDLTQAVVEWCAGKGHLGRVIAYQHQIPVTSVEWQAHLCEKGEGLAQKYSLTQNFIHANVLTESSDLFSSQQHILALHACGDLHLNLLERVNKIKPVRVSLSPCCYHLTQAQSYQPQSEEGKLAGLEIDKSILKLAIKAQLKPNPKITGSRRQEVAWRLAYQALRSDLTQDNTYMSLPSINQRQFKQSFSAFIDWALQHQNIALSDSQKANQDLVEYLELGEKQAAMAQKLELVRHLFRRALELWLVLDKALYLQEMGYQVELSEFCSAEVTPRNLLIQAHLADVKPAASRI